MLLIVPMVSLIFGTIVLKVNPHSIAMVSVFKKFTFVNIVIEKEVNFGNLVQENSHISKVKQRIMTAPTGCSEGEIRLMDGSTYTEGRVEICMSNEWGTICNQMWDTVDAGVVCRQLGLTAGKKYAWSDCASTF